MSQGLPSSARSGKMQGMSTLMEIEKAAAELPAEEQRQLLRFLLRITPINDAELPEPRVLFPRNRFAPGLQRMKRICAGFEKARESPAPGACVRRYKQRKPAHEREIAVNARTGYP